MVSMTTVSPELMVSTGFCALSYQPSCVFSIVAGSRCTFPGVPVATATVCASASLHAMVNNAMPRRAAASLLCAFI